MTRTAELERNLVLYRWHQVAARLLFAFPTAMLFLLERVPLGTALRLSGLYFVAVVALEVPSGWASDRFGRVPTMRLAALCWVASSAVFLVAGSSLFLLGLAQVLVAAGWAGLSGTDAAFHFDTLEALDRPGEFEPREAAVARDAFLATTVATLVGGALGLVDLRLPYVALLVAATVQFALAMRLVEPVGAVVGAINPPVIRQILTVVATLKRPGLAWIFVFMAVQQPLESLAFDLIPPWLTLLTGTELDEAGIAPLLSGMLVAAISLVGAVAAARSVALRTTFGVRGSLTLLAAIETVILLGMALVVSPFLLPVLALRSTQAAAGPVIVAAATAPHLERDQRATFLSIGSFGGRLATGLALFALGEFDRLDRVLDVASFIGVACLALLVAARLLPERYR